MSIVRGPRPSDEFAQIRNAALDDWSLSLKARGLLAYLLSRPVGWRTSAETMAALGAEGRDAIRSGLRELEQRGYLVRQRVRNPDGTWAHEHLVVDEPVPPQVQDEAAGRTNDGLSVTGEPSAVQPTSVEPPIRERRTEKEGTTTPPTPSRPPRPPATPPPEPEGFREFWGVWPIKQGLIAARAAYVRALTMTDPTTLRRQAVAYARTVTDPQYAVRASRWLAEQRWTDVYPEVLISREEWMQSQPPMQPRAVGDV